MALPAATWDGQKIVTVVSRNTGVGNNTTARSQVLDYVNLALWHISLQTPWDWLATTATDITIGSATATYNLPTASGAVFDDVYDVRLVGTNERTLDPLDRRGYDNIMRGEQDTANVPNSYFIYGAQQGGVITLVPTPSEADTLRIRYLIRQPTISDATSSSLAIADRYMPLVVFKSCEFVSAWRDPERTPYWERQYQITLARAINRDAVGPNDSPTLLPRVEHQPGKVDYENPDDLSFYPRG